MRATRPNSLFPLLGLCLASALPLRAQEGHLCPDKRASSVPVWSQLCQCVQYPSHSISVSRCECRDVGAMGFVTTGQTQACQ